MPPKKKSNTKDSKKTKKPKSKAVESEEVEETPTETEVQTEENIDNEEEEDNDDLSTEELDIDSETENKDCEMDKLIQDDMEFYDEDDSSEINQDTNVTLLEGKDRITNPRLTRYEMVRILGERTKQLTMGAKPLVKNHHDLSYEDIAIEELKLNMIPIKIKRPLPNNKIEVWKLNELNKKHLEAYINE